LHGIPTDKPEKLTLEWIKHFAKSSWDVCIVADYGLILPKRLLTVPAKGFLNMHPSLLPKLRGPSPIRSAILNDERDTGVSIMLLDSKMDHGPIIAQEHVPVPEWPPRAQVLEEFLAQAGGRLLAHTLPNWVKGTVLVHEQEHEHATFSKLFTKSDAYINLSEDPYQVLLKVRAFETWPGAYTFFERNGKSIRVLIIDAHIGQGGNLALDRVKPEGKNEMDYTAFASSGAVPASITHRE
jgi:methionyl-tRNA formyltransferase